jgi:hypothetical protein
MRDNILGLHNDWCAKFMTLARVRTEWVNLAISGKMGVNYLIARHGELQGMSHTGAGL